MKNFWSRFGKTAAAGLVLLALTAGGFYNGPWPDPNPNAASQSCGTVNGVAVPCNGTVGSTLSWPMSDSFYTLFDTGLPSGQFPQTIQPTLSELRSYVLGAQQLQTTGGGQVIATAVPGASGNTGAIATTTAGARLTNITTPSLTTSNGSFYLITVTAVNPVVNTNSNIMCFYSLGTDTVPGAVMEDVTPAASAFTIRIQNLNGSTALNGTLKITCEQFN